MLVGSCDALEWVGKSHLLNLIFNVMMDPRLRFLIWTQEKPWNTSWPNILFCCWWEMIWNKAPRLYLHCGRATEKFTPHMKSSKSLLTTISNLFSPTAFAVMKAEGRGGQIQVFVHFKLFLDGRERLHIALPVAHLIWMFLRQNDLQRHQEIENEHEGPFLLSTELQRFPLFILPAALWKSPQGIDCPEPYGGTFLRFVPQWLYFSRSKMARSFNRLQSRPEMAFCHV